MDATYCQWMQLTVLSCSKGRAVLEVDVLCRLDMKCLW